MRIYTKVIACLLFITFTVPDNLYAKKKKNNWDNYNHGDDDDDDYHSNDDDDDYYNHDDDDDHDNDIPLDGGLSFLAIAGAGLGIKKVRDNMSKKKNELNNDK